MYEEEYSEDDFQDEDEDRGCDFDLSEFCIDPFCRDSIGCINCELYLKSLRELASDEESK